MRLAVATLTALTLAAPAAARDPVLGFPVDCTLGESCFIQSYSDVDPGPGAADYACGGLSYDGHDGTDIALPSLAAMEEGVAVRAAAPGTVEAVRDGMADRALSDDGADAVSGRECGNGVVVSHGDGWETQYCHLKRGSVSVIEGQRVNGTTLLGRIGLSGQTQFPHLHFSVRRDGRDVDPFAPDLRASCGTAEGNGLWNQPIAYRPGGLIAAGFDAAIPDYDAIKAGTAGAARIEAGADALVLWGYAFGGREGDEIALRIDGPEGKVIAETLTLEKDQAQFFRAAGRRRPGAGWPPGRYHGEVVLRRDGKPLSRLAAETTVTN